MSDQIDMHNHWVKTDEEITALRASSRRLAQVVEQLLSAAEVGISTGVLGTLAEDLIRKAGGEPIFKGYGRAWGAPPFPAALCTSLNEEVVHGIPRGDCMLADGDLLKIDIGMRYQGMVSDMARMKLIGTATAEAQNLKTVTEAALLAGLATLRNGSSLESYAGAVEREVKAAGYTCVRDLVGHGVGRELHEEPQIPNYLGSGLPNFYFITGMTVALEPMVNRGTFDVRLGSDGWTFVTRDGKLSAHAEDTVLITESGYEVLTTL
jgi:methionyl aminopeptidase